MSPNSLKIIEQTLKKTELGNDSGFVEFVIDYFTHMHKGYWVYPGSFKKHYPVNIKDVYSFLSMLDKQGILKPYLEPYCPECHRYLSPAFETIDEFESLIDCECGNEFNPNNHLVVIYKVVNDGD